MLFVFCCQFFVVDGGLKYCSLMFTLTFERFLIKKNDAVFLIGVDVEPANHVVSS